MSVPNCFEKVRDYMKQMGRNIPVQDLRDMAMVLAEKQAQTMDPQEFSKLAEEIFIQGQERRAVAERAAKMITLQKIVAARDIVFQRDLELPLWKRIDGWVRGNTRKIGDGMNLSVEGSAKSLTTKWFKAIRGILDQAGDLQVAESGLLTKEITQELDNLGRGGTKAVSGSEQALRIAKVYQGVLADMFDKKSAFDPFLGKIQDYYHRQTHDRVKISAVDERTWMDLAWKTFGEKSFPELSYSDTVERLREIRQQIIKGTYESTLEYNPDPSDVMRRMAAQRTLIPKDWQAFHEYNLAFGKDNVHTSVLRAIEAGAFDIATIQKFGPRPAETWNGVMREANRTGSPEDLDALKAKKNSLEERFDAVTKRGTSPVVSAKAKFIRGAMALQGAAKLGSVMLRSWQDLANMTTAISDTTGKSYLSSFADAASSYLKFFASNTEHRRQAAESLYLFSRTALHNFYQELGMTDSGKLKDFTLENLRDQPLETVNLGASKLVEWQSRFSLMDRHISAVDAAMATVLSRDIGEMTTKPYSELPAQTQGALKRYSIGAQEWALLQHAVEDWSGAPGIDAAHGNVNRMLTMEGVSKIPDEKISTYAKEAGLWKGDGEVPRSVIVRTRTDLETKVGTLVNQLADSGSSTAGAAERAWMYGTSDPDSTQGVIRRMLFQFKSAMVKNYDTLMRSYYSNPMKPDGDLTRIMRHVVLASGLYTMGEVARQFLEGKTPEDPATPTFALKALLNSGAGGIMGDAFLSEITRASNTSDIVSGLGKAAVGPLGATAFDTVGIVGQMFHAATDDKTKFPSNDIAKLVTQNVPLQNLFYTKALFNYYFANSVREWASPGYTGRLERAVNQRPGLLGDNQHYFMFNPTE